MRVVMKRLEILRESVDAVKTPGHRSSGRTRDIVGYIEKNYPTIFHKYEQILSYRYNNVLLNSKQTGFDENMRIKRASYLYTLKSFFFGKPKCIGCGSSDGSAYRSAKGLRLCLRWYEFCSARCALASDIVKQRKVDTYFKKTGFEYSAQNPDVQRKTRLAFSKYDGGHPLSDKRIRQESKEKLLLQHGGVHYLSKGTEVYTARRYKYYSKHGVYHPSQLDRKNQVYKYHNCLIDGVEFVNLQGYESTALSYLSSIRYNLSELSSDSRTVKVFYTNSGTRSRYFPDFINEHTKEIIEVKSPYTAGFSIKTTAVTDADRERSKILRTKARACQRLGYSFRLLVINPTKSGFDCLDTYSVHSMYPKRLHTLYNSPEKREFYYE